LGGYILIGHYLQDSLLALAAIPDV